MGLNNVEGQWTISQSNGAQVEFDIAESPDGELHGSGHVLGGLQANGSGRIDGNSFVFTVDWHNNGSGGRYEGTFDPEGHGNIDG